MNRVPVRHGGVSVYILVATFGFALLGVMAAGPLGYWEPFLVLGMMLMLGLPHGATDHGLFDRLLKTEAESRGVNFYTAYLGVIALYGLLWWLFPIVAFGVFILMSVYHFGQSNWVDVTALRGREARLQYLLWGSGVLLTPIILHAGDASDIVFTMTGFHFGTLSEQTTTWFIGGLGALNVIAIVALYFRAQLSFPRAARELLGYGLLMAMFFTNSLLLGFTVYFVFWHSLTSSQDQLRFFSTHLQPEDRRRLGVEIMMVVGGAIAFCLVVWLGPGPEAALRPGVIGAVFIFISLLTLPHMLLVEQLYKKWSPVSEDLPDSALPPLSQTSLTIMQADDAIPASSELRHSLPNPTH